mmetsp:Transcript_5399/g.13563  ORF Transcript_5399/g.13563 Transcript_5399/m.13563 type:complete len:97 (+) Transcript_5399:468-758(+)
MLLRMPLKSPFLLCHMQLKNESNLKNRSPQVSFADACKHDGTEFDIIKVNATSSNSDAGLWTRKSLNDVNDFYTPRAPTPSGREKVCHGIYVSTIL